MTRLLLPEFSTRAAEPLWVDDVLVMVIDSSAESDVLSFVAEDDGVMTMKSLSIDLGSGVGVRSSKGSGVGSGAGLGWGCGSGAGSGCGVGTGLGEGEGVGSGAALATVMPLPVRSELSTFLSAPGSQRLAAAML